MLVNLPSRARRTDLALDDLQERAGGASATVKLGGSAESISYSWRPESEAVVSDAVFAACLLPAMASAGNASHRRPGLAAGFSPRRKESRRSSMPGRPTSFTRSQSRQSRASRHRAGTRRSGCLLLFGGRRFVLLDTEAPRRGRRPDLRARLRCRAERQILRERVATGRSKRSCGARKTASWK